MSGGIKKKSSTRAKVPVSGRLISAKVKPKPVAKPETRRKPKPSGSPAAVRTLAQKPKFVSNEEYNELLDELQRTTKMNLKTLKRNRSRLERREREIEEKQREIARLTRWGRGVNGQRQKLEERVQHLEGMIRKNGLDGDTDLACTESFKKELSTEFQNRRMNKYTRVKVLIVQWASDDLGVDEEAMELAEVFKYSYRFEVDRFSIPDRNSSTALWNRVLKFKGDDSPDTLLIFSYHGHGGFDENNDTLWAATDAGNGPDMPSSSIQRLLEKSRSDTILLYDTCHSADTAMTYSPSKGSVTELIAACGFHEEATGVGMDSFTTALINELDSAAPTGAVYVSEIYNRVLARLRKQRVEEKRNTVTPIHITLKADGDRASILLEPLLAPAIVAPRGVEVADNESMVHHIRIASNNLEDSKLKKWLMKAPSSIRDIQLNHIKLARETSSDDGFESH